MRIGMLAALVGCLAAIVGCSDGAGTVASSAQTTATLQITTSNLPDGTRTLGYSQTVQGTGGNGPYVWSVSAGSLPPGVALVSETPNANILGTPTADGTFTFTLQLGDATGQTTTQALSIEIHSPQTQTIAGTGSPGFSGDGGVATAAELNTPAGIAVDAAGHVFFADQGNNRIRRIDALTGVITTVAGTGIVGFNNDGLMATATQLNLPFGLVLDSSNNWIFTDSGNERLRKVDGVSSLVTTLAGTGTGGFNGNGPALSTQLNGPAGLAVEQGGTILVADAVNNRVRRINLLTGQVTTIAGTGTAGYNGDNIPADTAHLNLPTGVAVEPTGDILIADLLNHRVRRVNAGTGLISTVAGTGDPGFNGDAQTADQARLFMPMNVAVDKAGNILIADTLNHRVRSVNIQTGEIQTIVGTGVPGFNGDGNPATTQINAPLGLAVDSNGNLLLTESGGMRIRRISF